MGATLLRDCDLLVTTGDSVRSTGEAGSVNGVSAQIFDVAALKHYVPMGVTGLIAERPIRGCRISDPPFRLRTILAQG